MKNLLALAFTALLLIPAVTQAKLKKLNTPDKTVAVELKIGDKFYAESYFYTAAEYYKDAVRQDSTNRYATFWLAMSLLEARDYENAEVFFARFYSIKPGDNKTNSKKWELENEILFNKGEYYYGQVLHRNGKYDEAIEQLSKFAKQYAPKDQNDQLKKLAEMEIEGCNFAKTAPKGRVKIRNAGPGVNHAYNDDAAVSAGENVMYYTSTGSNDTLVFVEGDAKPMPMYKIMKSTYANGQWGKGKPVDNADINEKGYNVGNGSFNQAMNRFYFTKCLDMEDERSLCNIFVADYNHGVFSNVQRVSEPANSKEKYTATQPAVRTADDGTEIIYFSSDRPGGSGGMDIWYFKRLENGQFTDPQPVVGPINTPGDEVTPFFDNGTKTLYFSSDALPGMGGFDIFKSTENPDLTWSAPVNMGRGINTGADDLYYSISPDPAAGFLSSNREGSVPLNGIKTASDDIFSWGTYRYAVKGIVFIGDENGGPLAGATFKLYKKLKNDDKVLVANDSTSALGALGTMGEGTYFFRLSPESDYSIEVDKEGYQPKTEDITTKGLPEEDDTFTHNMIMQKSAAIAKGRVLEDGKGTPVVGATVELIEKFGNGMEKSLSTTKSTPYYSFSVDLGKDYKLVARKEGYFTKTTDLSVSASPVDTVRKDIFMVKLEMNKAYKLANVLYAYDKADLTESSKLVLDTLYQIMIENPTFIIELSSHTDGKGGDEYNMKLSQERAQSCVDYLISKGIAADRLVAKGYGKTRPIAPNTFPDGRDNPEGRALNRRTEFAITGIKKEQ
jgi:outer membrane protein OmpA-like peptidoglycan-associated protein/tetratricopeptide (TPR) repeat protein